MKQGKIFIRILEVVVLLVFLVYFGYSVFTALYNPLRTTRAIAYEAGAGCYTTGFVVRQEQLLDSHYAITLLSQPEGAKVGKGQAIAVGYSSEGAQDRQGQLARLEEELQQLQTAAAYQADPSALAAMDDAIVKQLQSFSIYANRGDMLALDQVGTELKPLILQRTADEGDLEAIRARIGQLEAERDQLRRQTGDQAHPLSAPAAGYFSGTADGYETLLTPQRLSSLSVDELQDLKPANLPDTAYGRLITEKRWYYVTVVDQEYLAGKIVGGTVQVSFAHDFYDAIDMKIRRIGDAEEGKCVLVLSCDYYIQDVTLLREQSADIVFTTYDGLRVPKDAVRMVEGKAGVYVLESASARWKPIEILYDGGESYIVRLDQSSTANLWPGDEIIVSAKDLFDGKVVS